MDSYKKLYLHLHNYASDAVDTLQEVLRACETMRLQMEADARQSKAGNDRETFDEQKGCPHISDRSKGG